MPRKIGIIMDHESWKSAPFDDPEWEFWTIGWKVPQLPRCEVAFEMHKRDQWHLSEYKPLAEYPKFLASFPGILWGTDSQPDVPNMQAYPKAEVIRALGWKASHFASTISYCLGMAAYRFVTKGDVDAVGLWGVELCAAGEWAYQRPNANRLVGWLEGAGVEIVVPPECMLLGIPYEYGYENVDEGAAMANAMMFESLAQNMDTMFKAASAYVASQQADEARRRAEMNGGTP